MNCQKCGKEFTEKDKVQANYWESVGQAFHNMCSGEKCRICGQEITEFSHAKKGAGGQGWQHKSCEPCVLDPAANKAREEVLREEMAEECGWIVRR